MRAADRWLQRRRIRMAVPYVRPRERLLDIGCSDGAFIEHVRHRISRAIGIDPLARAVQRDNVTILCGALPGDTRLEAESFDCIAMLATLEHVGDPAAVSRDCFRLLAPGGRLIATVPHRAVDRILPVLVSFGLSDAMELGPHRTIDSHATGPLFSAAGFRLVVETAFELGLNRLYVFEKPVSP
jgi:SAM-dependent methyltransferase